jgi:ATP-dependent Lon protease
MTTPKTRPTIVLGESHSYPVLPLRDIVVFPHMIVPLFVGREKSIRALEEVMKNDALILLATQKNASDDDPSPDSIYEVGTLASVLQLLKLPDGTVKVLVEGLERARVQKYSDRSEYYEATALRSPTPTPIRLKPKPGALGRVRLRKLCEAEQEDLRRSRRRGSGDH